MLSFRSALQSLTETEIALVPNWSWYRKRPVPNWACPCTELDMYQSGHVVPNTYFLEPK